MTPAHNGRRKNGAKTRVVSGRCQSVEDREERGKKWEGGDRVRRREKQRERKKERRGIRTEGRKESRRTLEREKKKDSD